MKPYRGLFCSLLLLLLAGSGTLAAEPPYRIVIFHTNDIHGKIAPLAKIARLVNAERRANPDVFLFGAGDNFSGNPVVDQAQPQGQPMLELFNRLGYNLVNLGNHEFDYGQQTLAYHLSHAHYGVVCANLKVKQGPLSQPKPYAILRTSHGDRLAVLGLIQVSRATSLPDSHPDKLKGLRFSEPLAAAQKFKNLRGRVQVFIALTHLGYEQDLLLAQAMPELDLIIGGHSHTAVLEPKEINGVLVTQAGSDGLYLGRVDITLAGGRVSDKRATLIDLAKVTEEDPQVKTLIDHFNDSPALQRVIARLPLPLSGKEEIGSLVTDAMRTVHRLDIAFQNNGGIRLAELRGEVRLKDIYQLDPFGNEVIQLEMDAAEIRSLIAFSFERHKGIDLQVSGLQYRVRQTPDQRLLGVELRDEAGAPLVEGQRFRVGLNSYLVSAYAFAHRDPGVSLKTTTAETLIQFLQSGADLSRYHGVRRVRLETVSDNRPAAER